MWDRVYGASLPSIFQAQAARFFRNSQESEVTLTDQTDWVDSNSLPNDQFGFRIYGVMAHLPEPQASQTRQFHKLIGADDLATKPHCSIDNFWGPDDLDAIKTALGDVAAVHRPFETSIDFDNLRVGSFGCAYELKHDDDHFAL